MVYTRMTMGLVQRGTQACVASSGRVVLLPLVLVGAFAVGLSLGVAGTYMVRLAQGHDVQRATAAASVCSPPGNILDLACYDSSSTVFFSPQNYIFDIESVGGTGTITVDPADNSIKRQVN